MLFIFVFGCDVAGVVVVEVCWGCICSCVGGPLAASGRPSQVPLGRFYYSGLYSVLVPVLGFVPVH